jgi:hypothetical protein
MRPELARGCEISAISEPLADTGPSPSLASLRLLPRRRRSRFRHRRDRPAVVARDWGGSYCVADQARDQPPSLNLPGECSSSCITTQHRSEPVFSCPCRFLLVPKTCGSNSGRNCYASGLSAPMAGRTIPMDPFVVSGRTFVALRKAGRPRHGRAPVFHAVTPHLRMSLCGDEPGPGSAWAEPPAEQVTCPECLRRLARLRSV